MEKEKDLGKSTMDVKQQLKDPSSPGSRGLAAQAKKKFRLDNPIRKYINIAEAVSKGCPIATKDIETNLENRQKAIDKFYYGPANPDKPGNYWKDAAKRWKIDEKTAKTMQCANCGAFDVSDDMRKCIEDGIRGDDTKIADARAPIDLADLGYCTFLKFKCAGTRTCSAWITGGPIVK